MDTPRVIVVPPMGRLAKTVHRYVMVPIGRRWRNRNQTWPGSRWLVPAAVAWFLREDLMLRHEGVAGAVHRESRYSTGATMGDEQWTRCRIVVPTNLSEREGWHVGWVVPPPDLGKQGEVGISRIPLNGPALVTIGPGKVWHLGIGASGEQVGLELVWEGEFKDIPDAYREIPVL